MDHFGWYKVQPPPKNITKEEIIGCRGHRTVGLFDIVSGVNVLVDLFGGGGGYTAVGHIVYILPIDPF